MIRSIRPAIVGAAPRVVAVVVALTLGAPGSAGGADTQSGAEAASPEPSAQPNAGRALTHGELLAIRGEREPYATWGQATLVAEAVIDRSRPRRGAPERGQGGAGFGTLPREDGHPGDPVVLASPQDAAMFPTGTDVVTGLFAFGDQRWSGIRTLGPVETPNGTYLTPIEPTTMDVADALPVGSQILVRGWFSLQGPDEGCPGVPAALDPNDDGGWGSPFVRCPGGWLTASEVARADPADPTRPVGFGIPVQWGAIEQFDRGGDAAGTSAPAATYLLRRVANPLEGAEPSSGWKVIGRVGPKAIPPEGQSTEPDPALGPDGLDWHAGMDRQPPADQWSILSTAWQHGFASIHVGADRVLSSWVSPDGRDWSSAALPAAIRSVAALLPLGDELVVIANSDDDGGGDTWRWETWRSGDGLHWQRASRERVPMPARFDGRRRVVQGFWSLGDRLVALATYTTTACCGRSPGWSVMAAQETEPDLTIAWVSADGEQWSRHRVTGIPQGGELHFAYLVSQGRGELFANKSGPHRELLRTVMASIGARWAGCPWSSTLMPGQSWSVSVMGWCSSARPRSRAGTASA